MLLYLQLIVCNRECDAKSIVDGSAAEMQKVDKLIIRNVDGWIHYLLF